MILSVSRRTDIPRFYFDWFLNRLKEQYVLVRNPMNHRQISRIELTPETVECIAFWTKNPAPMLPQLKELEPYPYYVQFTLNAYGQDIEKGLPKKAELIETFKKLAAAVGPERVVWRYSPVLLSPNYTVEHHLHYFEELAKRLEGHTQLCRISFLDMYNKIARCMSDMGITEVPETEKVMLAKQFVDIGKAHGITLGACGNLNLEAAGLKPVGCIDTELVARVTGEAFSQKHSLKQREGCYCAPSIDIGSYNTCRNGCVYCYANQTGKSVEQKAKRYNPESPMLCDAPGPEDVIKERAVKVQNSKQLNFL